MCWIQYIAAPNSFPVYSLDEPRLLLGLSKKNIVLDSDILFRCEFGWLLHHVGSETMIRIVIC